MDETEYLLSTEANRKHLLEAVEQFQQNSFQWHDVLEERLAWASSAWDQYLYWQDTDRTIMRRINQLINVCTLPRATDPDDSVALLGPLAGFRSRHIAEAHRFVYRLEGYTLYVAQCRFHYDDK